MPKYQRVPLVNLVIDPGYQREIIPNHLKKIRGEFEEAQLGVLEVSKRAEDEFAVFDGQHRLKVLEELAWDTAPCIVHTGLTPQEEADLFRKLQDNRKALTPIDKFKSRLFAEDPIAEGMAKIAEGQGYKIGVGPSSLQAVVVVERVYRRGNLYSTLDTVGIWRGDAKQLDGSIIDGVSRFLDLYPEADMERARSQWMQLSPIVLIRRSAEFMASAHSSKAYGVLEVLRSEYTSRQFRLPTVAEAQAERKATTGASGRRYRRLTGEEVRDAILELHNERLNQPDPPANPRWTIPDLMEKLSVGRQSLTKRGGYIEQFVERGMIVRSRHGNGQFEYEYIPPERQKVRRRKGDASGNGSGPRIAASKAVPYTGKPQQRTGGQNQRQREAAKRGRKIVQK
jgi:hypothetical protein